MNWEVKRQALKIALENEDADVNSFVLKNSNRLDKALLQQVARQIEFRRKIKHKIPSWYKNLALLAAENINLQQSSSEATALYKSNYLSGDKAADLTGGLGVDTYFLAKNFKAFTYNEPNAELVETVKYNFEQLGVNHISFSNVYADKFKYSDSLDWIYLDPSRRDESKRKLYKIDDCQPDLTTLLDNLLENTTNVMVKYSPMLDINMALSQLKKVNKVLIIADKNEVKELVFIIKNKTVSQPKIGCINLNSAQPEFWFTYSHEKNTESVFTDQIKGYLYEPNAAVLKAGAFKSIGKAYNLNKLSTHSHLYTSQKIQTNFPGKTFEIVNVTSYNKKILNQLVTDKRANITTRNFPVKAEEIRNSLNWSEGGDLHLFFTQDYKNKKIVIISKLKSNEKF